MMIGNRAIFSFAARRAFDGNKTRQCIGHFEAGEFLIPFFIADDNSKVEAEIRNMREGMPGV